jgi:hypothetical protein
MLRISNSVLLGSDVPNVNNNQSEKEAESKEQRPVFSDFNDNADSR